MNYLAHAYLSFNEPEILVGNMINDYVKGKQQYNYPSGIQKGLKLHRKIDEYTDQHPSTRAAAKILSKAVGRYANALTDVVYDHFLANDIQEFKDEAALNAFAQNTYQAIANYHQYLPEKFARMFPYMQRDNWLYQYRTPEGIAMSFNGVSHRSTYLKYTESAFSIFEMEYPFLKECYAGLWVDLKAYTENELKEILSEPG